MLGTPGATTTLPANTTWLMANSRLRRWATTGIRSHSKAGPEARISRGQEVSKAEVEIHGVSKVVADTWEANKAGAIHGASRVVVAAIQAASRAAVDSGNR